MALTRAINTDPVRYEIAKAIVGLCQCLHISVVAEGVETLEEAVTLRDIGVRLFQGYLFAKPAIELLPCVPGSVIEILQATHAEKLLNSNSLLKPCRSNTTLKPQPQSRRS